MDEYEFLLEDRIAKIKAINEQYDLEHNAYISFSGGKDSTVLHYLIDLALPNNNIPRLFLNTGIEYKYIREFVQDLAKTDNRVIVYNSGVNIKKMLEENGYPFKSKQHSLNLAIYQNYKQADLNDINSLLINRVEKTLKEVNQYGEAVELNYYQYIDKDGNNIKIPLTLIRYLGIEETTTKFRCPKMLLYQFTKEFNLQCSDQCCHKLKKEVAHKWQQDNNKTITLTGMRKEEGGQRASIGCIVTDKDNKLVKFHPLLVANEKWEEEFIKRNNIQLCKLYYPPYNFKRTGCKGCPFALDLQEQLDVMDRLLPAEKNQCEILWKPVYDEYRRIGFRLRKKGTGRQTTIFDYL